MGDVSAFSAGLDLKLCVVFDAKVPVHNLELESEDIYPWNIAR